MIDFSNLLRRENIFADLIAESRQAVLRQMSEMLSEAVGIDSRLVLEAVTERERLGSTAVGNGVSIPHVRLPGLTQTIGAFARLSTPVDFEAIDERHCDLVFMLLAPELEGSAHLRALAQISRAFRQASFREALRSADSAPDIAALLGAKKEQGQAA